MGWIGNKDLYPNETSVDRTDFIIGTDQSGVSKTFQLDDLQSLLDSDGYTRAQMQTMISNSALKVNVNYKLTDAGALDETIIVRASSAAALFEICYNISDTSELYRYDISTDDLSIFEYTITANEFADGATLTFENDGVSSEVWTSATIALGTTGFVAGKVVRINHEAESAPSIDYGGISVLGAVKGAYVETTPATNNIITFISREIDAALYVEVIYDDYLADATPMYGSNNLTELTDKPAARVELGLEIGVDVQAYDAVLAATTASFTTADETKLDGIEALAEVNTINTTVTGEPTGSDLVLNVVSLTTAEYGEGTPVATTLYIITDA